VKADLVLALVRAHYERNETFFRSLVMQAASHCRSERHKQALLVQANRMQPVQLPAQVSHLITRLPSVAVEDLVLAPALRAELETLAEEIRFRQELSLRGLPARSRLLFYGPPGNGKTVVASALGGMLGLEPYGVNLSGVAESHLGETGKNLSKLFDALSAGSLIIVDEIDAIGASRAAGDGSGGTREFNAAVNVMLTLFDRVKDGVLVGLTNRLEMLDGALRRRFDRAICVEPPTAELAGELTAKLCARYGIAEAAVDVVEWTNFDDIVKAVQGVARRILVQEIRKAKVEDAERATNGAISEGDSEEDEAAAFEGAAGG